jgi:hypothetical protein
MSIKPLKDFQVITRYSPIELPYAKSFLSHYKRLGVDCFHLLVNELDSVGGIVSMADELGVAIITHWYSDSHENPDSALKGFSTKKLIKFDSEWTLNIDMDEYLFSHSNANPNLLKHILESSELLGLRFPWMMCTSSCINGQHAALGGMFPGHQGKMAYRTKIAPKIRPHKFILNNRYRSLTDTNKIAKPKDHGMYLLHWWCRGFEDVLLKIFFSRMKSAKTSDQDTAREKLQANLMPNRLKILAFLESQKPTHQAPADLSLRSFDLEKASSMLLNSITEGEIIQAKKLYDAYKILLAADLKSNHLGRDRFHPYPAKHSNSGNSDNQLIRTLGKISNFLPDYSIP